MHKLAWWTFLFWSNNDKKLINIINPTNKLPFFVEKNFKKRIQISDHKSKRNIGMF